jgi:hypothetical protein
MNVGRLLVLGAVFFCMLLVSLGTPVSAAVQVEMVGQCGGACYAAAVSGQIAYVGIGPRIVALDISNLPNVAVLGVSEVLPGIVQGVILSGNYAYVAADYAGVVAIDISNPAGMVRTGGYDTSGCALGVTVSGNYLYVADDFAGLQVLSIAIPGSPARVGGLDTSGYACSVAVSGNYAYVADNEAGLQIIDVSNPESPVYAGTYDTPGYALDVELLGALLM